MREIILYILLTFCGTVWNVQPGLTQTAKEENWIERNWQQSDRTAFQNVNISSMDSENCVNHFTISVFQIGSEETEPESFSEYQVESYCQELKLCCTNDTFFQSVPTQDEVGIDYYLQWAKLKVNVSYMATNNSGWNYMNLLRNASSWLTAALLTHNISIASVHILCPEPPFGDPQQYPVFDFMLLMNQNYSLERLGQGFHNLTSTNEYFYDVELEGCLIQTGNTLTAQGQSVKWCSAVQETQSSKATSVTPETTQAPMILENVTVENLTVPIGKQNETDSTDSMWVKSSTTNSPNDAWPIKPSGQMSPTTTIVPNQMTTQAGTVTDKAAGVTMETAFTAFRASISITNWNFTLDLDNKSSITYRKLEELFRNQFSQLLTEAAEVTFNRTLDVTVLVEGFSKGGVIVNIILLTPSGENMTLDAMDSLLISAINQSWGSESGLHMSYENIEDVDSCENNTRTYICEVLSEMLQCTCLTGLNSIWLACEPNKTTSCGGVQAHIANPLVWELEKITQFLDFANGTGCSFSKNGILDVKDLCQNITDNITDLWLEWKNEVLSLYLEGPNIPVCQFSMTPEQEMTYKIIYSTGGVRGSFLVDYALMEDDQSVAFAKNEISNMTMIRQRNFTLHENESLNVTVSIQSGLTRNPQLFIKSCHLLSLSHQPVGEPLITNGCSNSKGLSIFHNGNSSLVVLSIKASIEKNSTILKCELQICAEGQCGCATNLGKINSQNSQTFKENYIEIGPIIIKEAAKTKDTKEPSILMVILISVGTILLVILLIGFLRHVYWLFSGSTFSIKEQNVFRRQTAVNPVTLKSWKQV